MTRASEYAIEVENLTKRYGDLLAVNDLSFTVKIGEVFALLGPNGIYALDPLICPKCQGAMRIIAFIEDDQIIQKILKHLGLLETNNHDPHARNPSQTANEPIIDDSYSQIPPINYWLQ
jgi:hypothetical protein